jgi:hypothetical protein
MSTNRNASFDLPVSTSTTENDILTTDQREVALLPFGLQDITHADAESRGTLLLKNDAWVAELGLGR